jgi:hypothetical protein
MSNAPAKKFRLGLVTVTVWKNEGQEKPFYTAQLSRSYKDADGSWKNGDNLNADDLLNAAWCLTKANTWIADQ